MNGEIDLELYTIAILRLNIAFEKLEKDADEALALIRDSIDDFKNLYMDIDDDLNQDEINFNEYYPFFEYVNLKFPQYINDLMKIKNEKVNDALIELIGILTDLNKLATYFLAQRAVK